MKGPGGLEVIRAPQSGLWRVARSPEPLVPRPPLSRDELDRPGSGNRFDSALGNYQVLYFGTSLECCFGETISRFRPDPKVVAALDDEDLEELKGFMEVGSVPADWRHRRTAVQVKVPEDALFVDVEHRRTRQIMSRMMANVMALFDIKDLDVAAVRGGDRRLTRWMSQFIFEWEEPEGQFPFAGIRYVSRLESEWEAWAIFVDSEIDFRIVDQLPVTANMTALQSVAKDFDLIVH